MTAAGQARPALLQLHRLRRWEELALLGWPDEARAQFIDSQYDFQDRGYRSAFPGAEYYAIERAGEVVGRLYVDRTAADLRLMEITLHPDWRGGGVGAALLRQLQAEVRAGRGACVRLSVAEGNPARRLYERLGFVDVQPPDEFPQASRDMVWRPES
ncbi:MAG TPA: GNAT family N-acetyltransferase [Caulobacteraceae bacterium]|jgi:ribosomal protein S18 acetylase RimI-like enzyme|nr:GNAT family N-acetyltransferase [Caulobacteraceae bacterium]